MSRTTRSCALVLALGLLATGTGTAFAATSAPAKPTANVVRTPVVAAGLAGQTITVGGANFSATDITSVTITGCGTSSLAYSVTPTVLTVTTPKGGCAPSAPGAYAEIDIASKLLGTASPLRVGYDGKTAKSKAQSLRFVSPVSIAALHGTRLGLVTGVTATADASAGSLSNGVYSYEITATDAHGETLPTDDVTATVTTGTPQASGTAAAGGSLPAGDHHYVVTAVQASGAGTDETAPSADVVVTATADDSGAAVNGTAVVSWHPVTGATGYNVYRDGFLVGSAAGDATSLTDDGTVTPDETKPAPTAPSGAFGHAEVQLAWTAKAGATGYRIYRSTTGVSGSDQLLATLSDGTATSFTDDGSASLAPGAPAASAISADTTGVAPSNPVVVDSTAGRSYTGTDGTVTSKEVTSAPVTGGTLVRVRAADGYRFPTAAKAVSSVAFTYGYTSNGKAVTATFPLSGATVSSDGAYVTAKTPAINVKGATGPFALGLEFVVDGLTTDVAAGATGFVATPLNTVSVTPAAGPLAGGTVITVTGTTDLTGATVKVCGVPATSVSLDTKNKNHQVLTAKVPAVVTTADGLDDASCLVTVSTPKATFVPNAKAIFTYLTY